MKLEPSAYRLHHFVRNFRSYFPMLFAKKDSLHSASLKLQKCLYACGHTVCAQVYGLVRWVERYLGLIHDRTMSVLMQFVLVKVCCFLLHFSQLLFQLTFAFGQRVLLIQERQTLILHVHHPIIHVPDDLGH